MTTEQRLLEQLKCYQAKELNKYKFYLWLMPICTFSTLNNYPELKKFGQIVSEKIGHPTIIEFFYSLTNAQRREVVTYAITYLTQLTNQKGLDKKHKK